MAEMFDKYSKNKNYDVPDNTISFLPRHQEYKDRIVLGADNEHCYIIPCSKEDINSFTIIYKQGIETKLEIGWNKYFPNPAIKWDYDDLEPELVPEDQAIVTYVVSAEDSLLFNSYNKQVEVQMQIEMIDGSKNFSEISKIKIVKSLTGGQE